MEEDGLESEFRVSSHVYVPKHEVLSASEVRAVMKKYNVKLHQFPYITTSDPVVKELGAKPGTLIRITRKSQTAGETTYYRYVVVG